MGDRQLHHVPHGQFQDLSDGHRSTSAQHDRRQRIDARRCWCSLPPATLAFGVMAVVRVHGSVKRRAAGIGRIDDVERDVGKRSLRHSSLQGRAARDRLHHQALFGRRQRRHEGAAPPADPGRHLRSARGRVFLPRAHRAGGRPRGRDVLRSCRWSATAAATFWLLVDRRRHRRLYRAEPLHRPAHQGAQGRAPGRLSGFHGSAGGVRRRRPEHGGGARAGRPRARRHLSVALPPTST